MLKIFRPQIISRSKAVITQCSCKFSESSGLSNGNKNVTESPNESQKKALQKLEALSKEELMKKTAEREKDEEYYSLLRTSFGEKSNLSLLNWIQQPIDLSPASIKSWLEKQKKKRNTVLQKYVHEKNALLGPELACAHFIIANGGAVKFHNDDNWIKAKSGDFSLPKEYQENMFLEAIDCTDTYIQYESMSHFRNLRNVEWLSLNGCEYVDDWCIDIVSNVFSHSLKYLDLRNSFQVTERGLGALYKIPGLKILYLDDMLKDTRYELTCLLLEELNPKLQIKSDVVTFEITPEKS